MLRRIASFAYTRISLLKDGEGTLLPPRGRRILQAQRDCVKKISIARLYTPGGHTKCAFSEMGERNL
jgi:hypothetical protein